MSSLSFSVDIAAIRAAHAWTGKDGTHHATIDLDTGGRTYISLNTVAEADALIAAAADAKANLLRLEAEAAPEMPTAGDSAPGGA